MHLAMGVDSRSSYWKCHTYLRQVKMTSVSRRPVPADDEIGSARTPLSFFRTWKNRVLSSQSLVMSSTSFHFFLNLKSNIELFISE